MLHQVASCIAFGFFSFSGGDGDTVAKMAGRTVWRVAIDVAAMRVGENGGRHDDSTTYRLEYLPTSSSTSIHVALVDVTTRLNTSYVHVAEHVDSLDYLYSYLPTFTSTWH